MIWFKDLHKEFDSEQIVETIFVTLLRNVTHILLKVDRHFHMNYHNKSSFVLVVKCHLSSVRTAITIKICHFFTGFRKYFRFHMCQISRRELFHHYARCLQISWHNSKVQRSGLPAPPPPPVSETLICSLRSYRRTLTQIPPATLAN